MLAEYLPRSQAALKRHRKRLEPHVAELRATPALAGRSDLELVLLALGDEATRDALCAYWQRGGEHPVTSMSAEDVQALDRGIAQAIVLSATCDPTVQVRQRKTPAPRRRG